MTANELMIGDYVIRKNVPNEILIVNAIDSIRGIVYLDLDGLGITEKIENIKPIPLTPEILEKNGWVYNNEDEKFFPQTWVGGGLKLQGADDCGYCIVVTSDYDDEDTNGTPFIIFYVHQLQHALRLCGIIKEIII